MVGHYSFTAFRFQSKARSDAQVCAALLVLLYCYACFPESLVVADDVRCTLGGAHAEVPALWVTANGAR